MVRYLDVIFEQIQNQKMFLKVGIKILFVAIEIFLGFYSLVVSESLLVKFVFFAVTAAIIAFGMLKTINKILPADRDLIPLGPDEEEEKEE
jgi:hypothetical protein